jgi:hypothetical protein
MDKECYIGVRLKRIKKMAFSYFVFCLYGIGESKHGDKIVRRRFFFFVFALVCSCFYYNYRTFLCKAKKSQDVGRRRRDRRGFFKIASLSRKPPWFSFQNRRSRRRTD